MTSREQMVKNLKVNYPEGTVIQLISNMDDPFNGKKSGEKGTVKFIDDIGQVHVSWESGGSLALIPGVDSFIKV